jgi:hypothetical protein
MGRRSEQRIAISFPVIVTGFDSQGSPFTITAETQDISCTGACLKGLSRIAEVGKKIEIECQDQRAWFRVQWVGSPGSGKAGKVGVRCLEPGKYIWGVQPKDWEPDNYEPRTQANADRAGPVSGYAGVASPEWTGDDRRKFGRRACRIEAQVTILGDSVRLPARITDISLGGCYVEMLAPLPLDTIIELTLNPGDTTIHTIGKVRSSQTGFGMGVSFTRLSPEDFEKLRKFAPPAPAIPETVEVASSPAIGARSRGNAPPPIPHSTALQGFSLEQATTAEVFGAVVRVLFRKGLVSQAELLEELEKLKPMKT